MTRWHYLGGVGLIAILAIFFISKDDTDAAQVNRDDLRAGLVAHYRDAAGHEVWQLDAGTLALVLKGHEAPHPRLSSADGTITWEGYLNVFRPGDYAFSATVLGTFTLAVDGKQVLTISGKTPTASSGQSFKLATGVYPLKAQFTRAAGDARLEVFWQSQLFGKEPLPLANLRHLPVNAPQLTASRTSDRGRFLVEEMSCVRCHQPKDSLAKTMESRQGPDLSKVGERFQVGWIYHWLKDPKAISPGSAMPKVFHGSELDDAECQAVARYLESLGGPIAGAAKPPKLDDSIKRGRQLFSSTGCMTCHPQAKVDAAALEASALHHLLGPSGASRTYPLPFQGRKTTPAKLASYLQNPSKADPSGRMPHMLLDGKESQDIANYLCYGAPSEPALDMPKLPAAEMLAVLATKHLRGDEERGGFAKQPETGKMRLLGERIASARGCVNCHAIEPAGKKLATTYPKADFESVKSAANHGKGCLAEKGENRGSAPDFSLGTNRAAIVQFLKDGTNGVGSPSAPFAAKVALQRFNCLVCHNRDGEGGLTPEMVTELKRYEKAENAESITPPTLTGVGHKLLTPWFREVLTKSGRSRPWMGLRMPQFGEAHVGGLPEAIAALEGTLPQDQAAPVTLNTEALKVGRQLIGKNNGYGCITCHDIAGIPNGGTRGPDLAVTTQHVRYDWYRRWLESAQRMDPGTKMPSIILDGKTMLDTVLGGNADKQAEAMWAYLTLGPSLPLPEGLEPPRGLVLAVRDRPVLLRTFMPDAGSRSIAVGFPGGVSTVFDATQCRLAYAWTGNFLDASPVWANRGGAPAKVLGAKFWVAPLGLPWGLENKVPPDFAAIATDPAFGAGLPEGKWFQGESKLFFEGVQLDKDGSPTFSYRIGGDAAKAVRITERPVARRGAGAVAVARHFSLENKSGVDLWLNAAAFSASSKPPLVLTTSGKPAKFDPAATSDFAAVDHAIIVPQEGTRVLIVTASAAKGEQWQLGPSGTGGWRLLLRVPGKAPSANVVVRVWSVAREDPALLEEVLNSK